MPKIILVGVDESLSAGLSSVVFSGGLFMTVRILSAILAAALIAGSAASPVAAQESARVKKATPQQQKMKDCASKWKAEKAAKHVSGQTEYRKFMSSCLKR